MGLESMKITVEGSVTTVRMPDRQKRILSTLARGEGVTLSEYIRRRMWRAVIADVRQLARELDAEAGEEMMLEELEPVLNSDSEVLDELARLFRPEDGSGSEATADGRASR